MRKSGNIAVWPQGGVFSGPLVVVGGVYEVKGHKVDYTNHIITAESLTAPSSPFGTYSFPTYKHRSNPVFFPAAHPHAPKKKTGWSKMVILVSLNKKGKGSSKSAKVEYEIVTQVTVLLDASTPSVRKVTELASKQVNLDVILLESKCYLILENEGTSGEAFWKSTRKVLAANRTLYHKLPGQSSIIGKASIDLMAEDDSDSLNSERPPSHKQPSKDCDTSLISAGLEDITCEVSSMERLVHFMSNMPQAFQGVVCRASVTVPVVAECCGRIVECQHCVDSWLEHHATCSHCSSVMSHHFVLCGFEDVLRCLQLPMEEQKPCPVPAVPAPPALSSS